MRPSERPLTVALAGCGAVGRALVRVLSGARTEDGRAVRLLRVLVKRIEEVRPVPSQLVTVDLDEFLASPAEVFVEAIGGFEPGHTIARRVLGRGGRLVTANKALIAAHGASLAALARESGGWLGFDAAVGGGVPVVRTLRDALCGLPVTAINGILNGTANYVLTRLEAGATLREALAEARMRGLAEADPGRDLDGRDVADKLAILAWVAWGIDPARVVVDRTGLLPDPERLVHQAGETGGRLRLVGECTIHGGAVRARVRPAVVAPDSPFGRTLREQNRVEIGLGWAGPLELSGPGAGGAPTASALWGDIQAAARVA